MEEVGRPAVFGEYFRSDSATVLGAATAGYAAAERAGYHVVGFQLGLGAYCALADMQPTSSCADASRICSLLGVPVFMELDLSQQRVVRILVDSVVAHG